MSQRLNSAIPMMAMALFAFSGVAVAWSATDEMNTAARADELDPARRVDPPTSVSSPTTTPTSTGSTVPTGTTPTGTTPPDATPTGTTPPGTTPTGTTPPWNGGRVEAAVAWPQDGATVSGFMEIWLEPDGPVQALKWFVDGEEVGYDGNGAPWVKGWDSSSIPNGTYQIHSLAKQPAVSPDAGRWFRSPSITVTVDNTPGSTTTRAPRDDLPGWDHIYADDFDVSVPTGGFPDDRTEEWSAYPSPWRDTSGNGVYDPGRVVSVSDGLLTKHLRTVDGTPRVAALIPRITDQVKSGQLYGRYEVRFRTSQPEGYKIAWLLWPVSGTNITGSASGTGGNGEIDFPEMDLDASRVMGFVHHQDAIRHDDQYWARATVDVSDWHTYTIEWSPDLVVFLLDGVEVGRTTERVPDTAMRWILQTETTLSGTTPASSQGTVEIDWVSAWSYDG